MDSGLKGRVVLIAGGAGGMGKAAAARFLEEEAVVYLADVDGDRAAAAAADLIASGLVGKMTAEAGCGPAVHALAADITKAADVERAIADLVTAQGRLDVLVNAAGLWVEGPVETMTEADWDKVVDVNLKGTFLCCCHAVPHLKLSQGCIVNISSDCGLVGTPGTSVYSASKGGVVALTKALAIELAPDLVRVNVVCPADVMTPMLEGQAHDFGEGDEAGYYRNLLTCYPQCDKARFIEPEEVGELIVYLASRPAAPITGAAVTIDFGTTAGYGYG
jgi:NAD(P)-dependent dehydrogenase (short-subunit alcohol dehydrogenase family)